VKIKIKKKQTNTLRLRYFMRVKELQMRLRKKIKESLRTLKFQWMAGTGEPVTSHLSWNNSVALTTNTLSAPHRPLIRGATEHISYQYISWLSLLHLCYGFIS